MKRILSWVLAGLLVLGSVISADCFIGEIIKEPTRLEVGLYAGISAMDGYNLRKMTAHLNKGDTLKIVINCPGGHAGSMMDLVYELQDLKKRGVHIITESPGVAMSGAALVFLMGDKRYVRESTIFMFHKARMHGRDGSIIPEEMWEPGDRFCIGVINRFMWNLIKDIAGADIADKLVQDHDVYVDAKQMLEYGLATKIL